MTTPVQAIADYQKFRARQAGDPPPATPATPPPEDDPTAERLASERRAIALLTPRGREIEAERIAAIAAAEPQMPQPNPRESLRAAHQAREAAAAEAVRPRSALDRANEHLASATAARDAAKRDFANIEAEHTQKLVEEQAAGSPGRVEPIAGEKRVALAEAERQAVEILREVEAVDQRRARLDALTMHVTALQRRQGAARSGWPTAVYTALQLERLRAAPRLPSQFSTPAGDAMVQQWSRVAAALDLDPEAEI